MNFGNQNILRVLRIKTHLIPRCTKSIFKLGECTHIQKYQVVVCGYSVCDKTQKKTIVFSQSNLKTEKYMKQTCSIIIKLHTTTFSHLVFMKKKLHVFYSGAIKGLVSPHTQTTYWIFFSIEAEIKKWKRIIRVTTGRRQSNSGRLANYMKKTAKDFIHQRTLISMKQDVNIVCKLVK